MKFAHQRLLLWILAGCLLVPACWGLHAATGQPEHSNLPAEEYLPWSAGGSRHPATSSASYATTSCMGYQWAVGSSSNAAYSHGASRFVPFDLRRSLFAYDFDGDGRSDAWYYDELSGTWYFILSHSAGDVQVLNLGGPGAKPAIDDYDGDSLVDPGVYWQDQARWEVLLSQSGYAPVCMHGLCGGVPAEGDYDGDGYADFAVMVPATGCWLILLSARWYAAESFVLGGAGDLPVVADYDGDQLADPAVYQIQTGQWILALSAQQYAIVSLTLGGRGYLAMPSDYDGDLKADPAVYRVRSAQWCVLLSATAYRLATATFGVPGALPYKGDYDNDGRADLAVISPDKTVMYLLKTTEGYAAIPSETKALSGETAE